MMSDVDRGKGLKALDDLLLRLQRYKKSDEYVELMRFVARFRRYSPFNAMLVHIQMPGARYVLRAIDWARKYQRTLKPNARPLVALQPMGPVMFLFDVSDTEGPDLPAGIEKPFETIGTVGKQLERTIENCKRDGIRIHEMQGGSQRAGSIQTAPQSDLFEKLQFADKLVNVRYEMLVNSKLTREQKYSTLVHELGHLYCGHLGSPNKKWWPDRRNLGKSEREFEAESISYLVCARQGLKTRSAEYLSGYAKANKLIPSISLDRVLVVSRGIEEMGRKRLKPRK